MSNIMQVLCYKPYVGVFEFVATSIDKNKTNFLQIQKSQWYSGEMVHKCNGVAV